MKISVSPIKALAMNTMILTMLSLATTTALSHPATAKATDTAFPTHTMPKQEIVASDTTGYRLVWHDEFNEDGPLNPKDWDYEHGFVRNQEPQWYQPENAVCENGNLVITARIEKVANTHYDAQSKHWNLNRPYASYTSSSVITRGKHELKYGRMEVRAKIPVSSGAWPAIWCLGNKETNGYWPACGEIDILEFYTHQILANACWSDANGHSQWNSSKTPFTHFTDKDASWADKFHIWRMDWDETSIRIYLDDEKLNEIPLSQTEQPLSDFCKVSNSFRTPQYLILNLALRSSDGIDETKFPLKYYIDYVRFYERTK